jgi:hypothetical protein
VILVNSPAVILDAESGQVVSQPLRHVTRINCGMFSPDGTHVATGSSGIVRIWPVMASDGPAPAWLSELAEAIAGHRLQDDDSAEVVTLEAFLRLRERLTALPPTTRYVRWLHWFFAEGKTRTVFPPR